MIQATASRPWPRLCFINRAWAVAGSGESQTDATSGAALAKARSRASRARRLSHLANVSAHACQLHTITICGQLRLGWWEGRRARAACRLDWGEGRRGKAACRADMSSAASWLVGGPAGEGCVPSRYAVSCVL
eukprot:163193-Chlamydomonas_euryale.AAC.1